MDKINLWLDDLREAPTGFVITRTYQQCINNLSTHAVHILSLDYNLGQKRTGYDVAKWIVERNNWPDIIYLHTADSVVRDKMYKLLRLHKPTHVKLYPCRMK